MPWQIGYIDNEGRGVRIVQSAGDMWIQLMRDASRWWCAPSPQHWGLFVDNGEGGSFKTAADAEALLSNLPTLPPNFL